MVEVKEHFSFAVQATCSAEKDNSLHSPLVAGIHFSKKQILISGSFSRYIPGDLYQKGGTEPKEDK